MTSTSLPASAAGGVLGYLHGMMGQTPIPPSGTMGQTPIPPRTLGLLPVVTAVSLPSPAAEVSAAGVSPGVSPGEVDDGPDHSEWSNDHHLRKEEGDDAEEFRSVPIPEEGMYYPSSSDDDDPVHLLDLDPTPAELIAELLRGRVVYGEDGKPLDPERIIPAMQDLLKKRNREEVNRILQQKSMSKGKTHKRSPQLWDRRQPDYGLPNSLPDSAFTGVGLPYKPDDQGVWLGGTNDLRTTVRTPSGECVAVEHPLGTMVKYTPDGNMHLVRLGATRHDGAIVTSGRNAHMLQWVYAPSS